MPEINLDFEFSSDKTEQIFNCSKRNILVNGGYGSGKTYVLCQKSIALLARFPGYRIAIGRYSNTELKRTTMQTFYKICPLALYDENLGGHRVDSLGYVDLINGSRVYWMHFDQYDEGALRSLEINAALLDQGEEIPESVYLTLDARVGRWDNVQVPDDLLAAFPNWPRNKMTGRPLAPAYMMTAINPPDEGEFHWSWQRYHPDSPLHQEMFSKTHAYFQIASHENKALPQENLDTMLTRDEEWVRRYVYGEFSKGEGAIHTISKLSIIDPTEELLEQIKTKAAIIRVLDHGASSPTCCTWWAALKGIHICFQEYYQPDRLISFHRQRITELSEGFYFVGSYADPQIFKKESQKYGGFWSVADEYTDSTIQSPPISWQPADNNEFANRNRINELLRVDPNVRHPITGELGAPRLYFIRKSDNYPLGCDHIIRETSSQKKELLDEINGKKIYSDERATSVSDHAYDTLRYYCSTHLMSRGEPKPKARPNSFLAMQKRIKAMKLIGRI